MSDMPVVMVWFDSIRFENFTRVQDAYWICDQKMHTHTINLQLRPPKRHNPRKEGEERHMSDQPVTGTHLDSHLISPAFRQIYSTAHI